MHLVCFQLETIKINIVRYCRVCNIFQSGSYGVLSERCRNKSKWPVFRIMVWMKLGSRPTKKYMWFYYLAFISFRTDSGRTYA